LPPQKRDVWDWPIGVSSKKTPRGGRAGTKFGREALVEVPADGALVKGARASLTTGGKRRPFKRDTKKKNQKWGEGPDGSENSGRFALGPPTPPRDGNGRPGQRHKATEAGGILERPFVGGPPSRKGRRSGALPTAHRLPDRSDRSPDIVRKGRRTGPIKPSDVTSDGPEPGEIRERVRTEAGGWPRANRRFSGPYKHGREPR